MYFVAAFDKMGESIVSWKNALLLMRIPFSVFLMPVYWFAVCNIQQPDWFKAITVFILLHFVAYPASNGYNSYFDKDTGSIGGLKNPPPVNKQLFILVVVFDLLAIILSYILVSAWFASMVAIYLLISKAYSYDKIRLKRFPLTSAIVVTVFQGAFIYLAVKIGISEAVLQIDFAYAIVSTLFLAGSYPLTQVYQHEEDRARGDITLSLVLGVRRTYYFATAFIAAGTVLLLTLYFLENRYVGLIIFPTATVPVLVYFNRWKKNVWQDKTEANFENTMKMNKISSISLSLAFILIFIVENTKLFF